MARDAPDAPTERQAGNVLKRIDALLAEVGPDKPRLLNVTMGSPTNAMSRR